MALAAKERARFLTSLRTDAAFRDEVRREVLTEELLGLPERFAAFVDEMHAFAAATNRHFEDLDGKVGRLSNDSGKLRGMLLEQKTRANPGYYLSKHARRARALDLDQLLHELGTEDISDGDYEILARTDVIVRGTSTASGAPAVFLIEATWRAHDGDIERQVLRRQVLERHGVDVIAVIASVEQPSERAWRYAAEHGVLVEPQQHGEAA
ncbi:MAG: hypothetical protein ACYDH5_00690 [Acidimicrobiales bacterium]